MFAVSYIRGLTSPLLRFYCKLHQRSRSTVNAVPMTKITMVFVIMFNSITAVLLWLPWYYCRPRPHAAL